MTECPFCYARLSINFACGQSDQQRAVVALGACVERGTVATDLAALGAPVNDDKLVLGIGLGADRLHLSATGVGAVTGKVIHVQGPQAERAMVARA